MSTEAFPKILGHIDLSQFDKYKKKDTGPKLETYLPFVKEKLRTNATEVNQEFPNLLNPDGRIAMVGPEAQSDQHLVTQQELAFSSAEGKTIGKWQADSKKDPAGLTEMAIVVLFYKYLSDDFIIARASKWDDYNKGIDQVVIEKKTGDIVCGVDELSGDINDKYGSSKRGEAKKDKIQKMLDGGGTQIRYGVSKQEDKLVRSSVNNIPAFYLSLEKEELRQLLEALKNNERKTSQIEEDIFSRLLDSLAEQAASNANWGLQAKSQLALEKLKDSFQRKLKKSSHDLAA